MYLSESCNLNARQGETLDEVQTLADTTQNGLHADHFARQVHGHVELGGQQEQRIHQISHLPRFCQLATKKRIIGNKPRMAKVGAISKAQK